ncbi:response regulator transcription factor [Filifactor alocis]|uniref:response regulator transcription factor n=1 Tax=Filifactor alocis TaxID=143361 RepID=UPI0028E893E3|nr:response regulator transcription factor [Filifactor alocis]
MNKTLIIDDDKELCKIIAKSIQAENMEADYCYSGIDGLDRIKKFDYQLVILDVMMRGMDGFETLDQIRKDYSVPVLMLTAKDDNVSKVKGLRSGADDYLTKPFNMEELIARVISLIRRYTLLNNVEQQTEILSFGELRVDTGNRTVTSENGTFELPPKEYDILLYLIRNQGRILTKQQIYEHVWGENYVYDDSNIMAVISRLRKKIESSSGGLKYIQTIKGIGYRFNREV